MTVRKGQYRECHMIITVAAVYEWLKFGHTRL